MEDTKRFSCVAEPSGLWMVWDGALSVPAMLDGCALEGLAEDRAEVARNILERIYGNQLDASSMRASGLMDPYLERDYSTLPGVSPQPAQTAGFPTKKPFRQSS